MRLKENMFLSYIKTENVCFYSTLVRLKVGSDSSAKHPSFVLFLFHIGAIKSQETLTFSPVVDLCFYSTLVRLKETGRLHAHILFFVPFLFHIGAIKSNSVFYISHSKSLHVSIPHWCD